VDVTSFNKCIDLSKKLLVQYPKSKWVDDAYLLWARALLGKDDPLQTVNMLQDFTDRYPKSPIESQAKFYLGVGYRQAHRYKDAERTLSEFLKKAPKSPLVPYAHLERARALGSLERWAEASAAAGEIIQHYAQSGLLKQARLARAEDEFQQGDYAKARADYTSLGLNARDDEERLSFLFHEADCLEAAHEFDQEIALLRGALSHEAPPPPQVDNPTPGTPAPPPPDNDRYGRITVRIGSTELLAGRLDDALAAYRGVVHDYPRTPLASEAQYRIGYAYETVGDDFEKARGEYARVKDISASAFATQALSRLSNLDRLAKYRTTGKDSLAARAESGFLLAEQYLFQLDKPDRAIESYHTIQTQFPNSAWSAKAQLAEAWVLAHKFDRKGQADSLYWMIVYKSPGTEAQLAARDYLEGDGYTVPDSLIKLPEKPLPEPEPPALTPPPSGPTPLGGAGAVGDSLGRRGPPRLHGPRVMGGPGSPGGPGAPGMPGGPEGGAADTTRAPGTMFPPDTTRGPRRAP
jgi:TolA-binding protein